MIVEPTIGTGAAPGAANRVAGIWPAACIALYWTGVMCSKPGGGTSQRSDGFFRRLFLLLFGERERFRSLDRDLCLRSRSSRSRFVSRFVSRFGSRFGSRFESRLFSRLDSRSRLVRDLSLDLERCLRDLDSLSVSLRSRSRVWCSLLWTSTNFFK